MSQPGAGLAVIVVAGGVAERFGNARGKQMAPVAGRALLAHTVGAMLSCPSVASVVVVTPPGRTEEYHDALRAAGLEGGESRRLDVVAGGARRQDSVAAGLAALSDAADPIAVHDGARPLVMAEVLEAAVTRLDADPALDGVVVGHPAFDTLKLVSDGRVVGTRDRSSVWQAQTPQVFRAPVLRAAYERSQREGWEATDDSALVELAGGAVAMVPGPRHNIKVTVPDDLVLVEAVLEGRERSVGLRVGVGYDVHALVEGRPLVLGGVNVPYEMGLAGHSDADVIAHALMDAILGAMRAGDIGGHFPDTDPAFAGISSMELLSRVAILMAEEGFRLLDADCVIALERPRISPYRDEMRRRMAEALGVEPSRIGVKATSTEGLGAIGRGEAASAQSVVLLEAARR